MFTTILLSTLITSVLAFDGTCQHSTGGGSESYTITIPGDGHAGCGGGLLDNMHGQAITVTDFHCAADPANPSQGLATFATEIGTTQEVNAAFQAAYGGTAGC